MNEQLVVADHRDVQACALCIDPHGDYAALAGRRVLAVLELEDISVVLRRVARGSKWDVSTGGICLWTPHEGRYQHTIALSSNQNIELYSWYNVDLKQTLTIRAHSRSITDLDWCHTDASLLLSSSVDDFFHVWDLREPRKPSLSFQVVAGVSQAKWSKLLPNILASTHQGDTRIWDIRKGTVPLQTIVGHLSKISSIDWNPNRDSELITAADKTIKIWDFKKPEKPLLETLASSPVGKIRFAPFGHGVISIAMAQLGRQCDTSISLWNTAHDFSRPAHQFYGHTDLILDFAWRLADGDWQLASVSKDNSFRLWMVDSTIRKLSGVVMEPGEAAAFADRMADRTILASGDARSQPPNRQLSAPSRFSPPPANGVTDRKIKLLEMELASLRKLQDKSLTIDKIDPVERCIELSVSNGQVIACVIITWELELKDVNGAPSLAFQFGSGSTLSTATQQSLEMQLQELSQRQQGTLKARLEACIRSLPSLLYQTVAANEAANDSYESPPGSLTATGGIFPSPQVMGSPAVGMGSLQSFYLARVPFPCTNGGRFCSAGRLVCWGRIVPADNAVVYPSSTPRAMAALSSSLGVKEAGSSYFNLNAQPMSVASYYAERFQSLRRKASKTVGKMQRSQSNLRDISSEVIVYDVDALLPVDVELAKRYRISNVDPAAVCAYNSSVANAHGRRDLAQMWSALSHAANISLKPSLDPDVESPFAMHPFGRQLVEFYIKHYAKLGDLQTVAVISCILGTRKPDPRQFVHGFRKQNSSISSDSGAGSNAGLSPYNTIHFVEGIGEAVAAYTRQRSNSLDDPSEHDPAYDSWLKVLAEEETVSPKKEPTEQDVHDKNLTLLNPDWIISLERAKLAYSDLLHRWGLLVARARVMNCSLQPTESHRGLDYATQCHSCGKETWSAMCDNCKVYAMRCAICDYGVKGLATVCRNCAHGGHMAHMFRWFEANNHCPFGCGCECTHFQNFSPDRTDILVRTGPPHKQSE